MEISGQPYVAVPLYVPPWGARHDALLARLGAANATSSNTTAGLNLDLFVLFDFDTSIRFYGLMAKLTVTTQYVDAELRAAIVLENCTAGSTPTTLSGKITARIPGMTVGMCNRLL